LNAPLVIFAGTLGFALAALLVRQDRLLPSLLAASGAALLAIFVLGVRLDEPFGLLGLSVKVGSVWGILGRAFVLGDQNRAAIGFLYLAAAFIFGGGWAASPGRYFFSMGLVVLAMISAALLVQPFLFAAVFLELGAMGMVVILATPEHPAVRGGLRLVILYSLAMMAILLAGWTLESSGLTAGVPESASRATVLLVVGFAVIMAVPPFHVWLPAAAPRANAYALTFVIVILQSAGLFFLLRFLDSYVWLRTGIGLMGIVRLTGAIMIAYGGLSAMAQRNLSSAVAYALLVDFGAVLLAVSAGTPAGYQLALGLTGARVVSLSVWALGAQILDSSYGGATAEHLAGAAYRSPLPAAAAVVGALSVAGVPLTAGFPGRWGLLSALATTRPLAGLALLAGMLAVTLAILRWIGIFLRAPEDRPVPISLRSERVLLGVGIGLCVVLGVFPQLLYPWVIQAASSLTNLVP
jgi:formate hydrogenlyase subunit 3/multisubunit Na+/H+ antiporter MnhD subunit